MNASKGSAGTITVSACGGGGDCYDQPPFPLFSDYIEMAYLFLVIVIGTPSNAYILYKLFRSRKNAKFDIVKAGFLLLKINLNVSDLLILVVLAVGKFFWLITYSWRGGDILCKLFNFLSMIALYISSNIVVCIAFDRFRNVLGAAQIKGSRSLITVHIMITVSWLLAIIWSVPQLWVWKTLDVYPNYPGGWVQCSDIWSIKRFEAIRDAKTTDDSNELAKNAYDISHLVLVFWGPLLLLVISYAFISVRLIQYSKKAPCRPNRTMSLRITRSDAGTEEKIKRTNVGEIPDELHVIPSGVTAVNSMIAVKTRNKLHPSRESERNEIPQQIEMLEDAEQNVPKSGSDSSIRIKFLRNNQLITSLQKAVCCSSLDSRGDPSADVLAVNINNTTNSSFSPNCHLLHDECKTSKTPTWRRQLRSRVFRTTLLVVLTHVIFWFPYNFYAIMKYIDGDFYAQMSEHANVFKDLQILITLINPFLYGFSR